METWRPFFLHSATWSPESRPPSAQNPSPANPTGRSTLTARPGALEAYLYGLYFNQHEITAETVEKARAYFEQAIALDPTFAPAVAALANCYWGAAQFGLIAPQQAMPRALELADEAIRLDPELAGPHVVRAFVLYLFEWDWQSAELEFQTALALNASSVDAYRWYGSLLTTLGRHDEAVAMVREAARLDPASPLNIVNVSARLYYARQYEAAIREADRALQLEPDFWMGHLIKGESLVALGKYELGIAALSRAEQADGGLEPASYRAYALARSGHAEEASALLSRLEKDSDAAFNSPFLLAGGYLGLGNTDRVLTLLERAYDDRDLNLVWNIRDPALDALNATPRFKALMTKLHLDLRRVGLSLD